MMTSAKVSMGDDFGILRDDLDPYRTQEIGSKGNHVAAGVQCFGVGMSIHDGFVNGAECRNEGVFEAGLMEHLQFQSGHRRGRVGSGGRTCATRDDEPSPVWTSLPITH